jgi:hypothetical protein
VTSDGPENYLGGWEARWTGAKFFLLLKSKDKGFKSNVKDMDEWLNKGKKKAHYFSTI